MNLVRWLAQDAYMASDPGHKCDTYKWVILRAHSVMADFVKHCFDDHPVMASAITRFMVCTVPFTPMNRMVEGLEVVRVTLGKVTDLRA